jgi:AICAR transformylase/IMP cyclohydrolase PurH
MAHWRALISVSDKRGLVDLAWGLHAAGATLIASGGTASALAAAGLTVQEVSDVTGFPEILDGRVKTLHPAIHGGILARGTAAHQAELAAHGLASIDLVVCNLYPFGQTVARPDVTLAEAVEQIDIGGVTLLRAAAKNHERVAVVCDPADYDALLAALQGGALDDALRRRLALKAFQHTASYDAAIAAWLAGVVEPDNPFPATLTTAYTRRETLRYGENPHQAAALYLPAGQELAFEQLGGKEMSYNNWLDMDAAWGLAQEFDAPTVCIIKHTNPCGVASAASLADAYPAALASDPLSAFGGIIAVNRTADLALAEAMADLFVEVVIAPDYSEEALARYRRKANLRILRPTPRPFAESQGDTGGGGVMLRSAEASPSGAPRPFAEPQGETGGGGVMLRSAEASPSGAPRPFAEPQGDTGGGGVMLRSAEASPSGAPRPFAEPQGDTGGGGVMLRSAEASLRTIHGGLLVQTADGQIEPAAAWQVVTQRQPTAAELADLDFAWRVAKHTKSNAIVFVKDQATVGVGAGQMSRVDSVYLAARRAGERAVGSVLASDAFFPFPDGVEAAAAAGVTAVAQPGGSMRDADVIAVCDRLGLAMCFTGARHFRH